MTSKPMDAQRKQLVGLLVMASGVILFLAGVGVLAFGGQQLLGVVVIGAGIVDLGIGVFLRISA